MWGNVGGGLRERILVAGEAPPFFFTPFPRARPPLVSGPAMRLALVSSRASVLGCERVGACRPARRVAVCSTWNMGGCWERGWGCLLCSSVSPLSLSSPLTSVPVPFPFPHPFHLLTHPFISPLYPSSPTPLHTTPILFTNPTLHIPIQSSIQPVANRGVLAILSTPCPHAPYCHRALVCRPNDT